MRTLFLNPPSFEGFDGGASSRWPASREIESYWYPVWLCYPAGMLPDSKVVDAPPHKISIEQTVEMAKEFELLVLFTSTPGFHVDVKMAEMMKDVNPKLKVAFVGPPVTIEPEKTLLMNQVDRLRGAPRVRLPDRRLRQGQAARRTARRQLPQERAHHQQPGRAGDRKSGRAALGDEDVQARPGHHALQRPVPAESVHFVLHLARLPGDVHVLPLAADAFGPSLAAALDRRRGQRSAVRAGAVPADEGNLLRRRYLQLSEGAHHRAVQEAQAAELHLVLHVARHHRLRHAEGDEGSRLPAADRGLRIGRSSRFSRTSRRARPSRWRERFTANCKKLGLLVHGDFIIGLPGETRESIRKTIDFAKRLDNETIQVSIAHPYPGTEFYDYVKKNDLITIDSMTDETGHQLPNIIYPGLDRGELVEWVERFYGEYYFRPRVIWRDCAQGHVQRRRAQTAHQGSARIHGAPLQAPEVRGGPQGQQACRRRPR